MTRNSDSRRNKSQQPSPRKRVIITDNDGWTHVTTHQGRKSKPTKAKPGDSDAAVATPQAIHDQLIPAEIPDGLTFEKLKSQFESHMERWQTSETWRQIKTRLERDEQTSDDTSQAMLRRSRCKNCVCIALGSPSGLLRGGLVDRRGISLYQLGALVTMLEFLNTSGSSSEAEPITAYAQDPVFNSLDTELLNSLNIKTVEHPGAFNLVDEHTFLYAPGAERAHLLDLLPLKPAMFFGGPLETNSISSKSEEEVITAFIERMDSAFLLPEFEPNVNAFWKTSLYWKDETT